MNPTYTTDDYQTGALYGDVPNPNLLTAQMVNQTASSPDDWQTVLTNGFSNAAVYGVNGIIGNALQAGQIQNAIMAQPLARNRAHGNVMTLAIIAAVVLLVLK